MKIALFYYQLRNYNLDYNLILTPASRVKGRMKLPEVR